MPKTPLMVLPLLADTFVALTISIPPQQILDLYMCVN